MGLSELPHVFIIGSPRSGTTWLQSMLGSQPGVLTGPETHFFEAFGGAEYKFRSPYPPPNPRQGPSAYFTEDAFYGIIRDAWEQGLSTLASDVPAILVVEKTPFHCFFVDFITRTLPQARFIHLMRDPRAVAASAISARKAFGPGLPGDAISAAQMWVKCVTAASEAGSRLGDRFMQLRYEDLQENTEAELRRCFEFAGVSVSADAARQIVAEHGSGEFPGIRNSGDHPDAFVFSSKPLSDLDRLIVEVIAGDALSKMGISAPDRRALSMGFRVAKRARQQILRYFR